jgi:hypothetical protein
VPFKTQAPLSLPGTLSTTEHWDQSSAAISVPSLWLAYRPQRGYFRIGVLQSLMSAFCRFLPAVRFLS